MAGNSYIGASICVYAHAYTYIGAMYGACQVDNIIEIEHEGKEGPYRAR